jgi:hypothetical protein
MVKPASLSPSLLSLLRVALSAAFIHLIVSFGIFGWQFPRGKAGLPENSIAGVLLAVLCFSMILLTRLDYQLPQRFRIPEFLYPVTWGFSAILWGTAVAVVFYFYRTRRRLS